MNARMNLRYELFLNVPLKANGPRTSSAYQQMPIILNVRGRVCASKSCIYFDVVHAGPQEPLSHACVGTRVPIYQQDDQLKVHASTLTDIDGYPIASNIEQGADMKLTLCTPVSSDSSCETRLMSFNDFNYSFSLVLPQLRHEGRHSVTIEHGDGMKGCVWNASFDARCKKGWSANNAFKCILAEEHHTTLVCCLCYTGMECWRVCRAGVCIENR